MNLSLVGKVALVTAATRGLGYATAEALLQDGAEVVICGRDSDRTHRAVSMLQQLEHGSVHGVKADVTDLSDLKRLFNWVKESFGGLDILVMNAGGPPSGGLMETEDEAWYRALDLTLLSVVRSIRLAVPLMSVRGGGRVLAITSSSVKKPIPGLVLSNAYRPAVQGVCKTASFELADRNIQVNCLAPGRFATDRLNDLDAARAEAMGVPLESIQRAHTTKIPMGRTGTPAEFGRVAAFLCSSAASFVNGSTLVVDGGSMEAL